jgi:hypothetical protein
MHSRTWSGSLQDKWIDKRGEDGVISSLNKNKICRDSVECSICFSFGRTRGVSPFFCVVSSCVVEIIMMHSKHMEHTYIGM